MLKADLILKMLVHRAVRYKNVFFYIFLFFGRFIVLFYSVMLLVFDLDVI